MGGDPKWEGDQAPHALFLPAPQAWESWNLISSLRQSRVKSRHLRACLTMFVLAEGFTGLFEAGSISADLEESGRGSQRSGRGLRRGAGGGPRSKDAYEWPL